MDELPEAVFTWKELENGNTEIIPGRAPLKDIFYEIARRAYMASAMESQLPGESQDPPSDEFLAQYFTPMHFYRDGKGYALTERFGTDVVFEMDYVGGLLVKAVMTVKPGQIFFHSRVYDLNHRVEVGHTHVLRTANMALEARL